MKWLAILLLTAQVALGYTDSIWTNLPHSYTNLLGQEFVWENVLCVRWTGDTNYVYTNTVTVGGVAYAATNTLGDMWRGAVTGQVPWSAGEADKITRKQESVLPVYVLPCFTVTPDYSLDMWFTNGLDRWPSLYPKADLMYHYPMCGIAVSEGMSGTNCSLRVWPNSQGELVPDIIKGETVYPAGYWIKSRDKYRPLVIAEWIFGETVSITAEWELTPDPIYVITRTNNTEYYRGWTNEFVSGVSRLFGLTNNQYPVFVVHPSGTNPYTGTLSLIRGTYGGQDHIVAEWTNEYLRVTNAWEAGAIELLTATQRCANAWLALGAPLTLSGRPSNFTINTNDIRYWISPDSLRNPILEVTRDSYDYCIWDDLNRFITTNSVTNGYDIVSLQYADKLDVYEGTGIWDHNLNPDQLTASYVGNTNLFLTSWTNWGWTNSVLYSGSTNIVVMVTNDHVKALAVSGNASTSGTYPTYSPNGVYTWSGSEWFGPSWPTYLNHWPWYYEGTVYTKITPVNNVTNVLTMWHYSFIYAEWTSTNGIFGSYYLSGGIYGSGIPVVAYQIPETWYDERSITAVKWLPEPDYLWWWLPLSEFPIMPPWLLTNSVSVAITNTPATEYFSAAASGGLIETYNAFAYVATTQAVSDPTVLYDWTATAHRGETNITISVAGSGVVSSVAVTGMYTGTPHRVHLYVKTSDTNAYQLGPSQYYHRLGIYPLDFTNLDTIVTTPVDPRRVPAYLLAFTNNVSTSSWTNVTYGLVDVVPYMTNYPANGSNYTETAHWYSNTVQIVGEFYSGYETTTNFALPILYPYNDVWGAIVGMDYGFYSSSGAVSRITNATEKYTVAGWTELINPPPETVLLTPPYAYSWDGFAVTNDIYTNVFAGSQASGLNISNLQVRGWTHYGRFTLTEEWSYTNSENGAQITLVDGGWYAINPDGDAEYVTFSAWPWSGNQDWTDIGGGPGSSPFCNIIYNGAWTNGCETVYTNQYEIAPNNFALYSSLDRDRFPVNSHDSTSVYRWESETWVDLEGHPWGWDPGADPFYWQNLLVPVPVPFTSNKPVSLSSGYAASETLNFQTNWSNQVGIKVLVEWQR